MKKLKKRNSSDGSNNNNNNNNNNANHFQNMQEMSWLRKGAEGMKIFMHARDVHNTVKMLNLDHKEVLLQFMKQSEHDIPKNTLDMAHVFKILRIDRQRDFLPVLGTKVPFPELNSRLSGIQVPTLNTIFQQIAVTYTSNQMINAFCQHQMINAFFHKFVSKRSKF